MYTVYWIRHKDHTDPYSQGYIGLTRDLYERIRSHRKNRKPTRLTGFISKYNWKIIRIDIMDMNLTLEDALQLEVHYRPYELIGLNLQRGGELGVNPEWYQIAENSKQHKEATSRGVLKWIQENDSTQARRDRAIVGWNNPNRKSTSVVGSNNPNATLNEDFVRYIKYDLFQQGLTNPEIASIFDVHPRVIRFIRIEKTWKHV